MGSWQLSSEQRYKGINGDEITLSLLPINATQDNALFLMNIFQITKISRV